MKLTKAQTALLAKLITAGDFVRLIGAEIRTADALEPYGLVDIRTGNYVKVTYAGSRKYLAATEDA